MFLANHIKIKILKNKLNHYLQLYRDLKGNLSHKVQFFLVYLLTFLSQCFPEESI